MYFKSRMFTLHSIMVVNIQFINSGFYLRTFRKYNGHFLFKMGVKHPDSNHRKRQYSSSI